MSDWCDVAWSYILDSTPMMASPSEYRDVLWGALHDGQAPQKSDSGGKGMQITKSDTDAMAAMLEQAKALRGETDELGS